MRLLQWTLALKGEIGLRVSTRSHRRPSRSCSWHPEFGGDGRTSAVRIFHLPFKAMDRSMARGFPRPRECSRHPPHPPDSAGPGGILQRCHRSGPEGGIPTKGTASVASRAFHHAALGHGLRGRESRNTNPGFGRKRMGITLYQSGTGNGEVERLRWTTGLPEFIAARRRGGWMHRRGLFLSNRGGATGKLAIVSGHGFREKPRAGRIECVLPAAR